MYRLPLKEEREWYNFYATFINEISLHILKNFMTRCKIKFNWFNVFSRGHFKNKFYNRNYLCEKKRTFIILIDLLFCPTISLKISIVYCKDETSRYEFK